VITIGGRTACTHGNWDVLVPSWRSDLRAWVAGEVLRGHGWSAIAETLNRERVPPLGGGEGWRASSVRSLHQTASNGRLVARS
jgi:hypothetical protein